MRKLCAGQSSRYNAETADGQQWVVSATLSSDATALRDRPHLAGTCLMTPACRIARQNPTHSGRRFLNALNGGHARRNQRPSSVAR